METTNNKQTAQTGNTLKSNVPVNAKTALEASQAIAISDKKQEAKKVDIASNEHVFLTWFMLLLQKLLETTKTAHGQMLETRPYMILFDALKKQGYSLKCFGALNGQGISKTMNYSSIFPIHFEEKTKLVSDGVIYHAIKNSKDFKVFSADGTRYIHYVNNAFHVFHVTKKNETLNKQIEQVELKKIMALQQVEREKEKTTLEAKKEKETKTEIKKEETKTK
jgi:hypothetical protein